MQPAVDRIVSFLRAHGARRGFGDPLGNLPVIAIAEPELAATLADADGHLGHVGVAYHAATRLLRVSSRFSGADVPVERCDDPVHMARVIGAAARAARRDHCTRAIELAFDLARPVRSQPPPRGGWDYVPFAGALVGPGRRVAVLAGPGVVRRGAANAVAEFAARTHVGVANTWGAKGLFRWDSPHHMGTVGLQAHDFELVFDGIDVVLTAGLDTDETRPPMPDGVQVIALDAQQLASLTEFIAPRPSIEPNPLYARLAAVAQPGYQDERRPYHPARVVALLRERLPAGGLIAADPGPVGWWVARTFSTVELGSVVVPAAGVPGSAAACAAIARLDGRPAIAATRTPSALHNAVVEWSARGRRPLDVSCWDGDDLPIDWSLDRALVDAAGACVAF